MTDRHIDSTLSADIINYLRTEKEMTLSEISRMLDLSVSFLSRVAGKQRSFTIEHLVTLEKQLGQPLPLLLLKATSRESVPKHLSHLYDDLVELLAASGKIRAQCP